MLWNGKYTPTAYKLRGLPPNIPKTQNIRFLKPFHPSPAKYEGRPEPEAAMLVLVEGEVEWEVQDIVNHRRLKSGLKYQVKWKNTRETQWLRKHNLINCPELLREYHRLHQIPLTPFLTALLHTPSESAQSERNVPHLPVMQTRGVTQLASPEDHSNEVLVGGG